MNETTEHAVPSPPDNTFSLKIGRTTYAVGVYFSETSKETLNDKIERMVERDLLDLKNNQILS